MSNRKAEASVRRAFEAVAKKNGVSIEEVRREIEMAISAARKNPAPKVQAFWTAIPCKGDVPTPEEVIAYITGQEHAITN